MRQPSREPRRDARVGSSSAPRKASAFAAQDNGLLKNFSCFEVMQMRVNRITSSNDALNPHIYYAGTHLVPYDPTHFRNRAKVKTVVENVVFEKFLEKPNGQLNLMSTSSTKERKFLEKRIEHANQEELFQRLNYISGVHYSQKHRIHYLEP